MRFLRAHRRCRAQSRGRRTRFDPYVPRHYGFLCSTNRAWDEYEMKQCQRNVSQLSLVAVSLRLASRAIVSVSLLLSEMVVIVFLASAGLWFTIKS